MRKSSQKKALAISSCLVAAVTMSACTAPREVAPKVLENGASDIQTGAYKIKNNKNEVYDITITRFVNSIVPLNADKKAEDDNRFVVVKAKIDNKSAKEANPQWILDKIVLVNTENKVYAPIKIKGDASDGPLQKDWVTLKPNESKQTYLTYEVGFSDEVSKVKVSLKDYPEAEWKVSITSS